VVPTKYWNKVVCVECFGNFACETQIELVRGSNFKPCGTSQNEGEGDTECLRLDTAFPINDR